MKYLWILPMVQIYNVTRVSCCTQLARHSDYIVILKVLHVCCIKVAVAIWWNCLVLQYFNNFIDDTSLICLKSNLGWVRMGWDGNHFPQYKLLQHTDILLAILACAFFKTHRFMYTLVGQRYMYSCMYQHTLKNNIS